MDKQKVTNKRYCMAFGCLKSNRNTPGLTFFKLPKDPERRRQWLIIVEREDLLSKKDLKHDSYEVCSNHFEDSAIKLVKKLKPDAVPKRRFCNKLQSSISRFSNDPNEINTDYISKCQNCMEVIKESEKSDTKSIGIQTNETVTLTQTEDNSGKIKIKQHKKLQRKPKNAKKLSDSEHELLEKEFNEFKKEL